MCGILGNSTNAVKVGVLVMETVVALVNVLGRTITNFYHLSPFDEGKLTTHNDYFGPCRITSFLLFFTTSLVLEWSEKQGNVVSK